MLNRLIQALEWKKVRMVIQYAVYMLLVMLLYLPFKEGGIMHAQY